jgi:hypothetical protein
MIQGHTTPGGEETERTTYTNNEQVIVRVYKTLNKVHKHIITTLYNVTLDKTHNLCYNTNRKKEKINNTTTERMKNNVRLQNLPRRTEEEDY